MDIRLVLFDWMCHENRCHLLLRQFILNLCSLKI
ncbi:unnamed protein product [Brassica rapa subsp. trilocularis]